jgi:hypothetical protein
MLRTARNRMPTLRSCSEHCKEQLCHYVVRKLVNWLANICRSITPGRFVVANFTSFRLTKSILLEMAMYNMQFKLVLVLTISTICCMMYEGSRSTSSTSTVAHLEEAFFFHVTSCFYRSSSMPSLLHFYLLPHSS